MMEFEKNVRWLTPRYATILQPAEARECLTRRGFNRRGVRSILQPAEAGFVCVDAVLTAVRSGIAIKQKNLTNGGFLMIIGDRTTG